MRKYTWMQNKRRRLDTESKEDEDDDIGIPFVLPKMSSSSIYSQYNHIYFNDDITSDTASSLKRELLTTESRIKTTSAALNIDPVPIYLHITTHGGCIHSAFSIVDCIERISVPVYTVADGFVASAGTLISLAGEKRYITRNAYMLIHELRSGIWGKMTSIEEEYANLKKIMDHIVEFYLKRTTISKKSLEKILVKDIIWNADECIKKGLVDSVFTE